MARKQSKPNSAAVSIAGDSAPPPRRQPVILKNATKPSARFAEVAGGTAAECAAICCCCPCGLVNLVVLAVVKLPAGLCRRALRRRKRGIGSKKKVGLLGPKIGSTDEDDDVGLHRGLVVKLPAGGEAWPARSPSAEVSEMEKEMWTKFYSTGFWRSPSQRE